MEVLTMKELLETGVHFGHRTRKWNPKMGRYIFTERKGIHIIDLEQTVDMFKKAYFFVRDRAAEGKEILFVGTKKQVQTTIAEEAKRCGAHYVNRRWLGGTLTNFATIKRSIKRMKDLEAMMEDGSIDYIPNKEAAKLKRELAKLQRNLDGLRHMERVPDILYVIDPDIEVNAVHEANILGIPVVSIVDTNCDPDPIDFPIPGNDDAIKATKLITSRIADAILEGREGRQEEAEEAPAATAPAEASAEAEPTAEVKEAPATAAESEPVAEAEETVTEEASIEEAPVPEEQAKEVPAAVAAEEPGTPEDEGTEENDDKK
ncbi:30S ribosomal protein S2 [Candidatus Bipolaricaulota bacterium]|nr:30S ribosomal protein S2 [Candidatus Bipolaricaulota bacterium]